MKEKHQNSSPEAASVKKKLKGRKARKWIIISMVSLAVIFFIVIPVVVNIYADAIIGKALREIIRVETNNAYQIEFEKVGFNIFKREINFQQIHLFNDTTFIQPDSLSASDSVKRKIQLDLSIPHFQFKLATVYRAIRHKELIVEKFLIHNPNLKIIHETPALTAFANDSVVRNGFHLNELHGHIKNYFSLLKIDRFDIENANLTLLSFSESQNDTLKVSNFSLMLTDFHLDSIAHLRKDRMFFSDSIALQLHEGKFRYRGKLHEITFDHLDISSFAETFTLKNVHVVQDSVLNKDGRREYLSLLIPEIKIEKLDVLAILDSNALRVEKIELLNPDILLTNQQSNRKSPDAAEISGNIFQAATAYFYPLKIDEFSISSGRISLPETPTDFSVPQFDLTVFGIFMDSLSYDERSSLFFADDLLFSNQNQNIDIGDSGWQVFYENLVLDTRSDILKIENLTADSPSNEDKFELNIRAPIMEISGKDFKNDFLQQTLSLKTFALSQASIHLEMHQKAPASAADSISLSLYDLYPLIEKTLKWITVDRLFVEETAISILIASSKHKAININSKVDITLDDFRIDEHASEQQRIFYALHHQVLLSDLSAELPVIGQKILFDEATLETGLSTLNIKNLDVEKIAAGSAGNTFPVLFEGTGNIEMTGVDFAGLYFGEGAFVDLVKILQPDVEIFQFETNKRKLKNKSTNKTLPFFLRDILVSGGRVKIYQVDKSPLLDAEIANLSLTEVRPGMEFSYGKTDVTGLEADLRNVNLKLPGTTAHTAIERFEASSFQSLVRCKNLSFSNAADTIAEIPGNLYALNIPEVSLQLFPFLDIYHQNVFSAGSISILQPDFKISVPPAVTANQDADKKAKQTFKDFNADVIKTELLKLFKSFDFDTLQITDGSFKSANKTRGSGNDITITGVDIGVEKFSVSPGAVMQESNLLFAKNLALQADNTVVNISEKDKLLINDISVSTATETLTIGSFNVDNEKDISGFELASEGFSAVGLDFFDMLENKNFSCDTIKISRPQLLAIKRPADKNAPPSIAAINVHSAFSDHFHKVEAEDLKIENASLQIEDSTMRGDNSWHFGNVNLHLKHLMIDSANRLFDDKIFYADDLSFSIYDFSETTSTGLYDFGAAIVEYTHSASKLIIESGFLAPNYPEDKFAELSGVQTDRMAFDFERFQLSNFVLEDFILNNRLQIAKAEVDGFNGDDYRDKSYPFPQHHFPPLPVSALRNVDFPLCVDTLLIRNAEMTYREYVPPALKPGKIIFTNLNLAGRNITNDPEKIARDSLMRFYISARLMDEGKMEVQLDFDLKSKDDHFRANGVVNAFDLTSLNPMLEHVAFVRINSGENELLNFNFAANNLKAIGSMRFNYNKLQIRLIDKDNLENGGSGEGFTSFIANTFVVRRNNPKFLGRTRMGEIYFTRDVNKSFFNFLAKSALSGISSTIRGGSEERREKKQLRRLQKQHEGENDE